MKKINKENLTSTLFIVTVLSAMLALCFYCANTFKTEALKPEQAVVNLINYYEDKDLETITDEDGNVYRVVTTGVPDVIEDEEELIEVTHEVEVEYLGSFKLTGYCPCEKCCGKWADGITATGTTATEGRTIAVDPDIIPLGSHVIINGHEYIAEDTGSAINEYRIDIYNDYHYECYADYCNGYADVYLVVDNSK